MATSTRKKAITETVVKYATVRNILIAVVVIGLLVLFSNGWSIKETKDSNKRFEQLDEKIETISTDQKKAIEENKVRDSIMWEEIQKKSVQREKTVTIIRENAKKNIENISKPDISNDELRRLLAK